MIKLNEDQKEYVRVKVQNAMCDNVDILEVIQNLEGFGLSPKEVEWAQNHLDWKVIEIKGE